MCVFPANNASSAGSAGTKRELNGTGKGRYGGHVEVGRDRQRPRADHLGDLACRLGLLVTRTERSGQSARWCQSENGFVVSYQLPSLRVTGPELYA